MISSNLEKLKAEIKNRKPIIFIGTGISVAASDRNPVANWVGLLSNGLDHLLKDDITTEKMFGIYRQMLDEGGIDNYLTVANEIKDKLTKSSNTSYQNWLNETVGSIKPVKNELINAIGRLDCPIFTTNYDSLLSTVLNKTPMTFDLFKNGELKGDGDTYDNAKKYIFHLHGYYEFANSVVLTKSDYDEILNHGLYQHYLKSRSYDHAIIMIGYGSGINDPNFSSLIDWIRKDAEFAAHGIYKIELESEFEERGDQNTSDAKMLSVTYGKKGEYEKLLPFILDLKPQDLNKSEAAQDSQKISEAYLMTIIKHYGSVVLSDYSGLSFNADLDEIYTPLQFTPTLATVRNVVDQLFRDELNKQLSSTLFFKAVEFQKLRAANLKRNPLGYFNSDWSESYLKLLLEDEELFSLEERRNIFESISELRQEIHDDRYTEVQKIMGIKEIYSNFKHFIILGHPGSGKTTLSKWILVNMARQGLGIPNGIFAEGQSLFVYKLPLFISVWKYVEYLKDASKKSLLDYLVNCHYSDQFADLGAVVSGSDSIIKLALSSGNALIILEGLDEIPAFQDRLFLIEQINLLIERQIIWDPITGNLSFSPPVGSEDILVKEFDKGNRIIITCRLEGDYSAEISPLLPRLVIEELSSEAVHAIGNQYMQVLSKSQDLRKQSFGRDGHIYKLYGEQFLSAMDKSGLKQLAGNPQILSLVASIFDPQTESLPKMRVDLYEIATQKMISKLYQVAPELSLSFNLSDIEIWEILQGIAERLQNNNLSLGREEIMSTIKLYLSQSRNEKRKNLTFATQNLVTALTKAITVNLGMLAEFGTNSYRFLHRTFQEFLAARSLVFPTIDLSKISKILDDPNWRVPVSMAFGMLSKEHDVQLVSVLRDLFARKEKGSFIAHFIFIDSINDIDFKHISGETLREVLDLTLDALFEDYRNLDGFGRLIDHRDLLEGYFARLKDHVAGDVGIKDVMRQWFRARLNNPENVAPLANILLKLDWFEEDFFHNLSIKIIYDSEKWNWPVNRVLQRFCETQPDLISSEISIKEVLKSRPELLEFIESDIDWFILITALFGGFEFANARESIAEYLETASYLQLNDNERSNFEVYYREELGDDPVYAMAVKLDSDPKFKNLKKLPVFNIDLIYKDSRIADFIFKLLVRRATKTEIIAGLKNEIQKEIDEARLCELAIALLLMEPSGLQSTALSDIRNNKSFDLLRKQLLFFIGDVVARSSSSLDDFLTIFYQEFKSGSVQLELSFHQYCKIFFSIIVKAGGYSVNCAKLITMAEYEDDQNYLTAEYLASKITEPKNDFVYELAVFADTALAKLSTKQINGGLHDLFKCVQVHKPVRTYPWPFDKFVPTYRADHPFSVTNLNCLANIPNEVSFLRDEILERFIKDNIQSADYEDYKSLALLFSFSLLNRDSTHLSYFFDLFRPGLLDQDNIIQLLTEEARAIKSIENKVIALCHLAIFHEEEARSILPDAITALSSLGSPAIKFQLLGYVFEISIYRRGINGFQDQVIRLMQENLDFISDPQDKATAAVRFAFFNSAASRQKYIESALDGLVTSGLADADENQSVRELCRVGKEELNSNHPALSKTQRAYIQGSYGELLSEGIFSVASDVELQRDDVIMLSLTRSFATLYQFSLPVNRSVEEELWYSFYKSPEDDEVFKQLLAAGIKEGFLMSPFITVIFDSLRINIPASRMEMLMSYLIKPANELLPLINIWFTEELGLIRDFAALLLSESKMIFEDAVTPLINLLQSNNDLLRNRAVRVFQHSERDPEKPRKRLSILGLRTVMKISDQLLQGRQKSRITSPLKYLFFDLLWDDPSFIRQLKEGSEQVKLLQRIKFVDQKTWRAILHRLADPYTPAEIFSELCKAVFRMSRGQISEEQWQEAVQMIGQAERKELREVHFLQVSTAEWIEFALERLQVKNPSSAQKEKYANEIIYGMVLNLDQIISKPLNYVKDIAFHNFYAVKDLQAKLDAVFARYPVNENNFENALQLLLDRLIIADQTDSTRQELLINDNLLHLVYGMALRNDSIYRKLTGKWPINQHRHFQTLLARELQSHPFFDARGAAFSLLMMLDDVSVDNLISGMDSFLDEPYVFDYIIKALPYVHFKSAELVNRLLEQLNNKSVLRVYGAIKMLTNIVLHDHLTDHTMKLKVSDAFLVGTMRIESKRQVIHYYTDIRIPPVSTLEEYFYEGWTKIQGLSGKGEKK